MLEIKQVAHAIAGPDADPIRVHFATIVAESELEVLRVQSIRRSLLGLKMQGDPTNVEHVVKTILEGMPDLHRLERYERRAFSRRNRALELM